MIVDPASNVNKQQVDVIRALIYTKLNVGNIFEFTEVAPATGVFERLVRLTPDQNILPGDVVVKNGDALFVQFSSQGDATTSNVPIDFSNSMVIFDKAQYTIDDSVKIIVLDTNANKLTTAVDTVEIKVWSTVDIKGLELTLNEIGNDIGIFTGTMSLIKGQPTSGTTLKVTNPADILTAKYVSKKALPQEGHEFPQTEVKDLFASALIGSKKIPIEFKPPSEPEIVDSFGNPVTDVRLGQVMIIQDTLENLKDTSQKFAYIVLIKDYDGITVSLSWMTGELPPATTLKAGQSWIPEEAGEYTVDIFLWESIDNPVVLAAPKTVEITATQPLE